MTTSAIRYKLYDYIRVADDKKLHAIYNLLENEIEEAARWWEDKAFVKELDQRYKALESGSDQGFTKDELKTSIERLRNKKYGR